MNNGRHPGLYLHIPFCGSKCIYCDFYSETDASLVPAWLNALEREVLFYRDAFPPFDTLYIGGGTPTILDHAHLYSIFELLYRSFHFTDRPEITVEANPNDITAEKIALLEECRVNRISLGVQSFEERDLMFLKRRHTAGEAFRAMELIRAGGRTSLSVDLIYGIPGQTAEGWLNTLERTLAWCPEHVSCYQLTVAEGTALQHMQQCAMVTMPGEPESEAFFLATARYLEERGYLHYEISNFAAGAQNRSRHNLKYWRHVPYLGLGPAAHSFSEGRRWWNCRSVAEYCSALGKGGLPVGGEEILTTEQIELESLYLGLRTSEGVEGALLASCGRRREILARLLRTGYVRHQGPRVVPTTRGFLVADRLASALS